MNSKIEKNINTYKEKVIILKRDIANEIKYVYRCLDSSRDFLQECIKTEWTDIPIPISFENNEFKFNIEGHIIDRNKEIHIQYTFLKMGTYILYHLCGKNVRLIANLIKKYKYFVSLIYDITLLFLEGRPIQVKNIDVETKFVDKLMGCFIVIKYEMKPIQISNEDKINLENLFTLDTIYDIDKTYISSLYEEEHLL